MVSYVTDGQFVSSFRFLSNMAQQIDIKAERK